MRQTRFASWVRRLRGKAQRLLRGRSWVRISDRFNRNSITVTSLMTPEQSGLWLLERLKRRLGVSSLAGAHLLDFGCGVRFTQAILNGRLPIGSYTGVDCFPDMIDHLKSVVSDPRFSYGFLDAFNPMYNRSGKPLASETPLPVSRKDYDVITMFSVITHQYPRDSEAIFSMLRRHVAPGGHLFFTCFLDPSLEAFEDRSEEQNAGRCFYAPAYLTNLVERCGWSVVNLEAAEPPLIGDSFLLRPMDGW